jgi:hypothetical protein
MMEGIKPGSSALQADAMTTSPRRQGYENKMLHSGESNDNRSDILSPKILLPKMAKICNGGVV